jgi:hypothetical protein
MRPRSLKWSCLLPLPRQGSAYFILSRSRPRNFLNSLPCVFFKALGIPIGVDELAAFHATVCARTPAGCWHWVRAAYATAAAQTRMVSVAGVRLDSRKSMRLFKGIIWDDISEFESHMPGHAAWSLWAMSGLRNYAQQRPGLLIACFNSASRSPLLADCNASGYRA